jgi:hypothetical protein
LCVDVEQNLQQFTPHTRLLNSPSSYIFHIFSRFFYIINQINKSAANHHNNNLLSAVPAPIKMSKSSTPFSLGDLKQGAKSLSRAPAPSSKAAAKGDSDEEAAVARLGTA